MPVEIKELVIRAVVEPTGAQGESRGAPRAPSTSDAPRAALGEEEREALVAAAVKEVLRILRASKER